MVMPEREMPGNSASAWARPSSSASSQRQLPDLARVAREVLGQVQDERADEHEHAG